MTYTYKMLPELGWAVLIGIVVVVAEALLVFDETVFTEWESWAVALAAAVARSVGASLLNVFRPGS